MKKFWCGSNFGLQTSWSSRSFFFLLYKPIVLRCSGYEKWWQQKKIKGNLYGFIDVKSIAVYSPSHIVELIYCFKCYFVPSFLVGISPRFNAICGPSKIASLWCLHSCSTHERPHDWVVQRPFLPFCCCRGTNFKSCSFQGITRLSFK